VIQLGFKLLNEYIRYDRLTGKLFWKKMSSPKALKGDEILNTNGKGYIRFYLKGKCYMASKVVWYLHYGKWPTLYIDHINGIRNDNRIINLREVSSSGNCLNKIIHRKGRLIGTYFNKKLNKWVATAPSNYLNRKSNTQKYLGLFKNEKDAYNAVVRYCKNKEAL